MKLDDFFTSTEMDSGLNSTSRVRELVNLMENETGFTIKNVRQWSAFASAILATEDKNCLDLFIQLNGLQFINRWLKDAKNFSNDTNDRFFEESVARLIQALEKLQVDYEKLALSGIWNTVKDLGLHSSSMVQDKAQSIFENWEKKRKTVETGPEFKKDKRSAEPFMGKETVEESRNDESELGLNPYQVENEPNLDILDAVESITDMEETTKIDATNSTTEHSSPKISGSGDDDGMIEAIDCSKIAKEETDRKYSNLSAKKSDIELGSEIVDPLAVARQVAIEVEKESVDNREQSCCSEKTGQGINNNMQLPDIPDSVSGNKSDDLCEKVTDEADPTEEESAETLDVEQIQEKGDCNFDLNLEVGSEDVDTNQLSTSAATSVFCLAPSLKQSGFDLNVAENEDAPSSLPSGDSSVEMNLRSRNFELDLNLATKDYVPTANFFPPHSNSSSSTSVRNIDLNDQQNFPNDSFDNSCINKLSNDSTIFLMGTRVNIGNGEHALGRTGGTFLGAESVIPYNDHSSVYGYDSVEIVPPFTAIYESGGSNGSIPYTPIVSEMVNLGSLTQTGPFFLNSNSSNGVGSSRSGFDLNSRTMVEGGSCDSTGPGLFLNTGQVLSIDEQLRSSPQKRKEPDSGWECYPIKPCTPPWM